jgi:hypothetical protein
MDELYVESFSKYEKEVTSEVVKNEPLLENHPIEIEDFGYQMSYYLDRLEREITKEYEDFSDFRFVFDRIKKKIKAQEIKDISFDLDTLEELLDVDLPMLNLKSRH